MIGSISVKKIEKKNFEYEVAIHYIFDLPLSKHFTSIFFSFWITIH